jgi:hypothetical protein
MISGEFDPGNNSRGGPVLPVCERTENAIQRRAATGERLAHKVFKAADGREWQAWEVDPNRVVQRILDERVEDDRGSERHRRSVFTLPPALRDGWLAFQCDDECRRLAPIPRGWATLPTPELIRLLDGASPAPRRNSERRDNVPHLSDRR